MDFGETVAVEGPGSDALSQSGFESVKQACSRTIQTSGADLSCARGASPSMRERRINRGYDALHDGSVARRRTAPVCDFYRNTAAINIALTHLYRKFLRTDFPLSPADTPKY